MRRYRKYICAILTAAVLLAAGTHWPVPTAEASENAGEESLYQDAPQSEALEDKPETGDDSTGNDPAQGSQESAPESAVEAGSEGNPESLPQEPEEGNPDGAVQENGEPDSSSEDAPQQSSGRTNGDFDQETLEWIEMAGEALAQIAAQRDIMALVYLSDEYPIRKDPSFESESVVTVLSGQTVNILDFYIDENMEVWYYVKLDYMGAERYGYVPGAYLASSDERLLEWEEQYGMNAATYAIDGQAAASAGIDQFPESYRPALLALLEKHPNWKFVPMKTTLDWETVIQNELQGGKSLVYKSFPEYTKEGLYDSGNWYYASEAILKLYMDPRNHLTEDAIFQFELLTYNETYHTLDAITSFLNSTSSFLKSSTPPGVSGKSYADIFYSVGKGTGVSPFHLTARVMQEQGQGTSPLISGTYPGYENCYNYFNVSASGTTNQQVYESGLKYARDHGWTDAEKSIQGGATVISANYIKQGQDTLYLQKYNVNPNGGYAVYTHQYMQNISAPTSEAKTIKNFYNNAGALDSTFVFKIPVYENMPETPCPQPTSSTNVVLKLPNGYSDATVWLDGVAYTGAKRNGRVIATAADGNAKTAVLYKYDEAGLPRGMYVWSLSYGNGTYTATEEPGLEDLLTYHGFSIRITGNTGIRYKTGISVDLRAKLLTSGVDGYKLKEYGTLVMNRANMGKYPMIKGGEKVAGGISYGMDSSGKLYDVVFGTVEGRYHFTSVLVGLPVEQYKTEYAFRGYAILEKNGAQITVYGPARARSMYDLAKALLENGSYQAGSDAYTFLQKLISDADALQK